MKEFDFEFKNYERNGVEFKSEHNLKGAYFTIVFERISENQWDETDESAIARFWLCNELVRNIKCDPRVWVEIEGIDRKYSYTYDGNTADRIRFNVCYIRETDGDQVVTRYTYSFGHNKNTKGATYLVTPEGVHQTPTPSKPRPEIDLATGDFPYPAKKLNKSWEAVAAATE